MRNSEPDASVYWLARMLGAGEDSLYVAWQLIRFASEDVGDADPQALSVAVAAKDVVHFIGMPEGNTALARAAICFHRTEEQCRAACVCRCGRSRRRRHRRTGAATLAQCSDEVDDGSRSREGLSLRAR
jgi:hypothetical protein